MSYIQNIIMNNIKQQRRYIDLEKNVVCNTDLGISIDENIVYEVNSVSETNNGMFLNNNWLGDKISLKEIKR